MKAFKKNQVIITALAIMIAVAGYINFTDKSDIEENSYVFNNEAASLDDLLDDNTGTLVPNEESQEGTTEDGVTQDNDVALEQIVQIGETTNETTDDSDAAIVVDDSVAEEGVVNEAADEQEAVEETIADNGEDIAGEAILVSSTSVESAYFLEAKISREQVRAESLEILLGVINNESLGEEQKIEAATQMMDLSERIEKEAAAESLLEAKGFEDVFVRMSENDVDVVVSAESLSDTQLAQIYDVVSRKTGFDADAITITPLKINS